MVTVNLTPINTFLTNPGIGWQQKASLTPILSETVYYPERANISWKRLNPADGIYDWTALENEMHQAEQAGKQIAFRIYNMQGESFGGHHVPDWVLAKGGRITDFGSPDYNNCVFQQEWSE